MNDLLEKLLQSLKGTSAGTRIVAALVGISMVAIIGLAAIVTNRPHYELAFSGLTDHELAQVCKALSDAEIPFEQSQPPGPFTVYVDESRRSSAYMAAYGAGALDKPLEGILSDSGVSSVFNSAEERAQSVRKREWQEMENMLEELDFVSGARVRTSTVGTADRADSKGPSASVTLRITGKAALAPDQAETIANLVSRGLGIAKSALVISDQSGRSLYDGEQKTERGHEVRDMLAHKSDHDRRLASEANAVLEQILGPNKARVTVSSEWDFAQSTTSSETVDKKATVIQESKTTSEKPLTNSTALPVAGVSSNTLDSAAADAVAAGEGAGTTALMEKTSEEKKDYAPSIAREERVRIAPELKRLSVALFLDQSVAGEKDNLEEAIKAAVGFDPDRRDEFSTAVLAFVAPPQPEPEGSTESAPSGEPNPLLEILLRRGVEISSALVFLVLLLRTLKGSKPRREPAAGVVAREEESIDPELLARARVDELLRSDPAKVGEILSRWAREEPVTSGK